VIPRRYGQIKRQAGEGVALQVDAADALTRFAHILAGNLSPPRGWTINRLGLHAPAGRTYRERDMRIWWQTCEQARLFREAYDRETL
jgi:hypothetical protein